MIHDLVVGFINNLDYYTTKLLFEKKHYSLDPLIRNTSMSIEEIESAKIFDNENGITNQYLMSRYDKNGIIFFIQNIFLKRFSGSMIDYNVASDGFPVNLFFDINNPNCKSKYYKKTEEWKHEEEFRLVVSLGGRNVIKLSKEAIKNIYLGCNMKTERIVEIAYTLAKNRMTAGLYRMKRVENCHLQEIELDSTNIYRNLLELESFFKTQ